MPELTAIVTTQGRAELAAQTFAPTHIAVGSGVGAPTNATTALVNQEALLACTLQVEQDGDDVRIHVVALDETTDAYDVREWALVDAGGDYLAVYGDAAIIASKAAGSVLHVALDVSIVDADAASVVVGATSYVLPTASETVKGAVELATDAEVAAASDPERVVTASRAVIQSDLVCAANLAEYATATTDDVYGLTYNPTTKRWLACGDSGMLATSDDGGRTWTARTPGSSFSGTFYDCHWSPDASLYIAVGSNEEIQTSPDGVTWTRRNTNVGPYLYGVHHDGTNFIAVGATTLAGGTAQVMTSPDGTTWTGRTPPTSTDRLEAVVTDGAGNAVAVGQSTSAGFGRIAYSSDNGVTWSTDSPPSLVGELYAVDYVPEDDVFVAGGIDGDICSSDDPATPASWTALRTASSESDIRGLVALSAGFAFGVRGGVTSDPADPLIGHSGSWREVQAPTTEGALCAAYGDGVILSGLDGGGVLRSLVFGHRL